MFVVLYKFQVIEGLEKDFENEWKKLTYAFMEHAGGLGSRLHKNTGDIYIAYAQWPDQDSWKTARTKLPEHALGLLKYMRAKCENIEVLYTLDEVNDLLKTGG